MPRKPRPAPPITAAEAVESLAAAGLVLEWYESETGPHAPNAWAGDLRRYRQNLHRLREAIGGETSAAGIVGRAVKGR